ncbi:MAG TPA: ABC transporter ATP-binding protein [Firmicutes bacterium]|nr:ABC transporter ATP-binding protein [Bacillota bacterium]
MIPYLFRNYIVPFKWRFLLGFALLVGNSYLTSILPVYLMKVVDGGIQSQDVSRLWIMIGLYVLVFIAYIASIYIMSVVLEALGQDILIRLKTDSFIKVLNWDYKQFTSVSAGKLVTRVEGDAEKVRFFFVTAAVTLLQSLFMLIFMGVIMFRTNGTMAMLIIYPIPLVIGMIVLLQKLIFPLFKKVRRLMAEITSKITEYLNGLDIIKSYGKEELYFKRFDDDNKKKYFYERNAEFGWIAFFNFLFMLQEIIIAMILKSGASYIVKGLLTYGAMIMFIEYVRMFFFPLINISEQISQVQRSFAAFSRVYDLHTTPVSIQSGDKELKTMTRGIDFKGVSFSYKEGEPVLKNVSFSLPVGQKWALVGETGGGKSTIVKLLLRFYDIQEGAITLDGIDIREMNIQSLRQDIALIEQDFYLFPATVLDNIRLFDKSISLGEVQATCVKIGIDRFISTLPRGYETNLHEEGGNLSVGERQLLSIARAMVKKADLVLMDEATSSIDPHTEKMLEKAMRILMKGRTSLVVAHRLSTVKDADRILVVHQGEIAEHGNHDALMRKRGLYYHLCQNQLAGPTQEEGEK